jgi:Uma2 family endonuclease
MELSIAHLLKGHIMTTSPNRVRWTTADLELFPDDGKRYEIIDGELIVPRAPRWSHQEITGRIFAALDTWSQDTGLGRAAINPGIIFTNEDNVIPDVVWASNVRLDLLMDEAEHLTGAPELVVEVLSPGEKNEQRDKQLKLKLYSQQGVQEYWIVDKNLRQVQIYRRDNAMLVLVATLQVDDTLTSPLLPDFACPLNSVFGQRR